MHLFLQRQGGRLLPEAGDFQGRNTKIQAELFKIKGWVKNLDDGRVEAVFEGETDCVANLLKWCKIGPPGSSVTSIECHDESCSESFRNFTILR